jgi:hypothetical protein
MIQETIPVKERIRIRNRKIKALWRLHKNLEAVVADINKLGYSVSRTTVFFAINGRVSKEAKKKRSIRKQLKKTIN